MLGNAQQISEGQLKNVTDVVSVFLVGQLLLCKIACAFYLFFYSKNYKKCSHYLNGTYSGLVPTYL